jgi:hypothetical protein
VLFHVRGEEKLAAVLELAERSAHKAIGDSVLPRELVEAPTNDSTLPKPDPAPVPPSRGVRLKEACQSSRVIARSG